MYTEINLLFVLFCVLRQDISVCSPQGPGIHSVDQAVLELRHPPASAGIKKCAATYLKCKEFFLESSTLEFQLGHQEELALLLGQRK